MRHGMKRSLFISTHLENQLVRVDAIRQEEGRAQVPLQLRYFLDKGQQLRINCFLVLLPLLCQLEFLYVKKTNESVVFNPKAHFQYSKNSEYIYIYYLFFCIKDFSLLVTWPPQLLLLEVGIVEGFGDLHTRDVNFGVCGNHKLLVGPAHGDSVQGKRACAKETKITRV